LCNLGVTFSRRAWERIVSIAAIALPAALKPRGVDTDIRAYILA
jgi:hypothetical protein